MLHFEPLLPVPLVSANPNPTTEMSDRSFWSRLWNRSIPGEKSSFSDIANSHHFYKDKYLWSRHSGTLTPGMISGSTDSPLQSTLQSTFTDNAEILKIPFSSFLLPNDTAPRESTTFHEDSCFVTTGRHFIFSQLGSPECHSHFE